LTVSRFGGYNLTTSGDLDYQLQKTVYTASMSITSTDSVTLNYQVSAFGTDKPGDFTLYDYQTPATGSDAISGQVLQSSPSRFASGEGRFPCLIRLAELHSVPTAQARHVARH
jgi:hypothetical protein